MHGRVFFLKELRYGFEEERFVVRVDVFPESIAELEGAEFRIAICAQEEAAVVVHTDRGRGEEYSVGKGKRWLVNSKEVVEAAEQRRLAEGVEGGLLGLK